MHTIVNTPSVFTCKTPSAGWLNLAQVRQVQFEELPNPIAVITWHNGEQQTFFIVSPSADNTGIALRLNQACRPLGDSQASLLTQSTPT